MNIIFDSSMPMPLVITIIAVAAALAVGIAILLYFTLFAHIRAKKSVRELSRRFEYLHALLFGQDSQYIKRIEIISLTNLLYVNTLMNFNKRFKDVRDKSDSNAQTVINNIKDLLSDHRYKELQAALPAAKAAIQSYDEEVNSLNDDLLQVIKPEEDCRQQALLLKENLRQIKQDYYVKQADLSLVSASFERVFRLLDDQFKNFETFVESAQYEEANALLPKISAVIKELGRDLNDLPNICITISTVVPDKINSLENRFQEMTEAGYPLHHLISKANIDDMRDELVALTKKVQQFDLVNVQSSLDAILAQVDEFCDSFEKEKEARITFESECDSVYAEDAVIEKKFIRICNALPDVKKIYVLPSEEQSKIDLIKNLINKAGATKRSLDTFIHSGTKQPYSLLVEKMHTLHDEASQASGALDDFDRYLMSLKNDSEAALAAVKAYYDSLQDDEFILRKIGIKAVTDTYQPDIDALYGIIDAIYSSLRCLPIDVVKVNDLVSGLKSKGDEVAGALKKSYESMLLADAAILYANRQRRDFGDLNALLEQTESLYYRGDFQASYADTTSAIKRLRGTD